jgi:hypothetical protein
MLAEATLRALDQHVILYERAVHFDARPRERMLALGEADELFYRLHPQHYRALQTIRVAAQLSEVAGPHREVARRCESRMMTLVTGVIRDAIEVGDLPWRQPPNPAELAFSVWALAFGTRALMDTSVARTQLGIQDGHDTAVWIGQLLFDALGWAPLTTEWDYAATRERIRIELFPDEWRAVSAA